MILHLRVTIALIQIQYCKIVGFINIFIGIGITQKMLLIFFSMLEKIQMILIDIILANNYDIMILNHSHSKKSN